MPSRLPSAAGRGAAAASLERVRERGFRAAGRLSDEEAERGAFVAGLRDVWGGASELREPRVAQVRGAEAAARRVRRGRGRRLVPRAPRLRARRVEPLQGGRG